MAEYLNWARSTAERQNIPRPAFSGTAGYSSNNCFDVGGKFFIATLQAIVENRKKTAGHDEKGICRVDFAGMANKMILHLPQKTTL